MNTYSTHPDQSSGEELLGSKLVLAAEAIKWNMKSETIW